MRNSEPTNLKQYIRQRDYFRSYDIDKRQCSCSKFWKYGLCKHELASSVILGDQKLPPEYDETKIFKHSPEQGRPKKVNKALNK